MIMNNYEQDFYNIWLLVQLISQRYNLARRIKCLCFSKAFPLDSVDLTSQ